MCLTLTSDVSRAFGPHGGIWLQAYGLCLIPLFLLVCATAWAAAQRTEPAEPVHGVELEP